MFKPGMGGFGGNMNIQNLMKQAQKMQSEMQEKLEKAEEELANTTLTATAGGGMVEVKMNGKRELVALMIKPEVVDPDDIEMLEDLIIAAINDANKQIDKKLADIVPAMPGGMF